LRQLILMKKGVFKVGDPRDIGFHDENDHPWRLPPGKVHIWR
jgi:hypothetical protein